MIARLLKLAAVSAALVATPAEAQRSRERPIHAEAAAVIQLLVESAPFETWDDLRDATFDHVNWRLQPPDEAGANFFHRSGWLEADGARAGIAACGRRDGPEVVTLRVGGATWGHTDNDPIIVALTRAIHASRVYHEPTMVGEVERYRLQDAQGSERTLLRVENCSREGRPDRCDTTYLLEVGPTDAEPRSRRPCDAL